MADPLADLQVVSAPLLARQVVYSLQRKESADEDDDRVSHFFVFLGFYRRRYSGSDPTVTVENRETPQEKM